MLGSHVGFRWWLLRRPTSTGRLLSPSRRRARPRINCHRPPFVRSDRLILVSPAAVVTVASLVAIGAVLALLVESARRRQTARQLADRDGTIDRLTGDVASLRSMLQDYTQQREAAEEVLRRGEERYRVLVENLTTVVFQVDRDLRWTFLNP